MLPSVGTLAGPLTVTAEGAAKTRSFAQAVLDNLDQLRENDHVDSAGVTLRIVSNVLVPDTTFSGVKAVHTELVTESGTISLCNRTLSAAEQRSSSIVCDVDHSIEEAALRQSSDAGARARVRVQVQMDGTVTATKIVSTVNFEAELDADFSL